MICTLLWKEYRELRTTAVAVTVFAVGLLFSLKFIDLASAPESSIYASVAVAMVWMAGLVAGAQPFAGEVENRTQSWLDVLPAARRHVGHTKIAIVTIYTLMHTALLFALGLAMAWFELEYLHITTLAMIAFGLSGLGCGLYASSLARSPLAAIGWALVMQAVLIAVNAIVTILLAPVLKQALDSQSLLYAALLCSPLPIVFAVRRYTKQDRWRNSRLPQVDLVGNGWRSLIWLTWRQSRIAFLFLTLAGLAVGIALQSIRVETLWPVIGLVFGIFAGVGVFAVDQRGDAYRFLGDRRIPFDRLWLVKSVLAFAYLMFPVFAQFLVGIVFVGGRTWEQALSGNKWPPELSDHFWAAIHPSYMLLGPLYGFAIGQLLGMICRKGPIAVVLSIMLGFGVLVVWWPSIIVTGLHVWQWLLPPLLLIAATRWLVRPWVGGRLGGWQPASLIAAASLGALAMMFGGLWYRVTEIPERGDPFDVAAFKKTLPTYEQNEAGWKIPELLRKCPNQHMLLGLSLSPDGVKLNKKQSIYVRAAQAANAQDWPVEDVELNQELDIVFADPWFDQLREAVALPLGMFVDVRSAYHPMHWLFLERHVEQLLEYRTLQLAGRGQAAEAFDTVFLGLDLSRHLRSKSPGEAYNSGAQLEQALLKLMPRLLAAAIDQPDLLAKLLTRLMAHDQAVPSYGDSLRLQYLTALDRLPTLRRSEPGQSKWDWQSMHMALQAPWEQARTRGILATLFAGFLRFHELPYADIKRRTVAVKVQSDVPQTGGFDWTFAFTYEPAISTDVQMQYWLDHSPWGKASIRFYPYNVHSKYVGQAHRRAAQLQLALVLYQQRHGKLAHSLAELVPEFLPELPRDPFDGAPFRYRISTGETIRSWRAPDGQRTIPDGTGVLWTVGPELKDTQGLFEHGRDDIIFLVPVVKKP